MPPAFTHLLVDCKHVEPRLHRGEDHVTRDANGVDFRRRRLELLARYLDLRWMRTAG